MTPQHIEPRYFTLTEAGRYLGGLTAGRVRHMVYNGLLPVSKLGGRLFIDRQDIDNAMAKTKVQVIEQ